MSTEKFLSTEDEHSEMTYAEKKSLLESYRITPAAIKRLRDLIRELESEAEKITASISRDGGGGYGVDTAKLQRCVERLDDAKMRLLAEEAELAERKSILLAAVAELEDDMERGVILGHYIQGRSFQALCFSLSYSRRQIFRLCRRGIDNLVL